MRRAPNPKEYWAAQTDILAQRDPALYLEVKQWHFEMHGGGFSYQRDLSERLIKQLTNVYEYAASTYLRGVKDAVVRRERNLRFLKKEIK